MRVSMSAYSSQLEQANLVWAYLKVTHAQYHSHDSCTNNTYKNHPLATAREAIVSELDSANFVLCMCIKSSYPPFSPENVN